MPSDLPLLNETRVATPDEACACTPVVSGPTAERELLSLVAQLKALAHPIRLRMVDLIHACGGRICVCDFEHHFDVKQPTISHHLKILREAGLIHSRQEASWVHHFVDPSAYTRLRDLMDRFATRPPA